MRSQCQVTIVGGGNSTHTLIPLLANGGHSVNLLTRNPDKWSDKVTVKYVPSGNEAGRSLSGRLNLRSSDPGEVIPGSTVILLSLPVCKYRLVLDQIGPYIDRDRKIYVGTIYGQGGFNWMVDEIKAKYGLRQVVTFACGLLPWIARTGAYGRLGLNYGPKALNVAAVSPANEFEELKALILDDLCFRWFKTGGFVQAGNFLSLSLSVDNQIIHLARMYGLHLRYGGRWKAQSEVPLFYADFDAVSATLLMGVDKDYSQIRQRLKELYPHMDFRYMLSYLELERLSYNSSNTDIRESFTSSRTLGQIPTPTVRNEAGEWVLDKNHRFFGDDVYYGLCIAKWIGERLGVQTRTIDAVLHWAQQILADVIIEGDHLVLGSCTARNPFQHGLPGVYGHRTIADIIACEGATMAAPRRLLVNENAFNFQPQVGGDVRQV
jgi:opine dehydrogenase